MKDFIYSLKLIFTPLKILICILLTSLMPLLINATSMFDFNKNFATYISIIGIVVFAEIPLIDKKYGMDEIVYLAKKRVWKTYFVRMLSGVIAISLLVLLSGYIFVLKISYKDILIAYDINTQIALLSSVLPYILLIGVISMTISNIFRSVKFGYILTTMYWLANALYREQYIVASLENTNTIIYILSASLLLILVNLHLDSLKPIKRGILVKLLKVKEIKYQILLMCREYNLFAEKKY